MELLIFSIPFVVAAVLLIFFRKQTVWWEYPALIVPSIIIALLLELCCKAYNATDTEYLGSYITKIRHEDSWNEYIHRTCTKVVACGKDKDGNTIYKTVTYDCSYVRDHPDFWMYFTNTGNTDYISEQEYSRLRWQFGTPMRFIDMHRDYYTKDGDAQEYDFDGDWRKARTLSESHKYQNKVQTSRSIFKFEEISDRKADSLGLYRYPAIIDDDQCPFIGYTADKYTEKRFRWLNARLGKQCQFRTYLLFYRNQPVSIVEKQRSYWQGANKNEMIVCIGIDSSDRVQWCECLSWSDEPRLEAKTKQFFLESDSLRLIDYADLLFRWVPRDWHRKKFEDFSYITVELSDTQY